ncbi:MAG: hypothetical protein GY841_03825 [FCB group bacterium]|nr:hypothetical protein [FCB group bacterium]
MTAIGGPLRNISVAGREFRAAGDATIAMKLGGDENEVSPNGDKSTARIVKTTAAWTATGGALEFDSNLGDQEFLQEIADGNDFVVIAITLQSGVVYQGTGIVTGELALDSAATTGVTNFGGPGKLTKQ